ncbi:multiple inositol polyphosphate phosphatase 1-like [Arctopsyche grandis]|uniref:multiple inositol polyphosphate phosphatase 1-like n=1 Tax=Arctopsyche grandis TaxID=121162 RepID=UPI00406D6ADE
MATGRVFVILSGLLTLLQISTAQREGYCLSSDYEPYLLFSTKTAYEFVKGKENNQHFVPDCVPIQFWSINRHGTRLPSKTAIDELPRLAKTRDDIISNYEIRKTAPDQGRLCSQDIENLKNWIWNRNFSRNYASDLTYQGYDDLKYLAKRWQSKYPEVLPATYSPKDYLFRYTEKRRAKDSYRAFIDGLFGRDSTRMAPVETNDTTILQAYNFCTTWMREVLDSPVTKEEMNNFKNKEEFKNMIQNVSFHLGYRYSLEEGTIKNIYDMCRYDKAWEINKNSPWCAAFTKDQLRLLEYIEDLKSYYETGYGNELNKKIGCLPLKDMMDKFTRMIDHPDQDQPKASIYFTHSKAIQTLLTSLGIAHDSVPLLADNYHTPNVQRRKWKTSLIDPFASNLVAVLYRCSQDEKHRVMFFLNERPVEFDDCKVGLCTWEVVQKKYGAASKQCNLDFCHENGATRTFTDYYLFSLAAIVILSTKLSNVNI